MGKFEDVLDIMPVEVVHTDNSTTTVVPDGDEDADALYARAKHYQLSEVGSEALALAMKVAKGSENPRAIEVLSGLIKNLAEVNKSLLSLHKDKADVKTARGAKHTPSISDKNAPTTNIIFAGSSSDLNKLIASQLNKG